MSAVCFFFSIHEPFILRRYNVFDLGQNSLYEDDERNCARIRQLSEECYLPTLDLLLKQVQKTAGQFRFACHVSLPALELFDQYMPEVIQALGALAETKSVEFVAGAAHSLAFLYSRDEFTRQLKAYTEMTQHRFGQRPTCFCSTELIYNNDFASCLETMDYKVMLAEGTDHILGWRSPNYLYMPASAKNVRLLLRNRKLSRDLSLRFRNRDWDKWPLTADKYADWCSQAGQKSDILNIFVNMNIFGHVNKRDTGIFEFMNFLPSELLARNVSFMTPNDAVQNLKVRDTIDVNQFVSWDDAGGDLNSWLGNDMQKDAVHFLYSMTDRVHALDNPELTHDFRRLQTSDYLRWMSTRWFSNYIQSNSPFANPQDAYTIYMNILADFEMRLEQALEERSVAIAKNGSQAKKEEDKKEKEGKKSVDEVSKAQAYKQMVA